MGLGRVVVAGHVNWDVTLRVDRLPREDGEARIRNRSSSGGGSAGNVAVGLADLDVPVSLIGSVGTDSTGTKLQDTLENRGIDTEGLQVVSGATTTKYLLVADDGTVAVLGNKGVNEALTPATVPTDVLHRGAHLHVTNHQPDTLATLARTARENGLSISVDLGRRGGDREYTTVLQTADIVFGTKQELDTLFGSPSDGATADRAVVCTRGDAGASYYTPTTTRHHAGYTIEVTDTSGAGDAFVAGFLRMWLADRAPHQALAVGNACGALTSTERGTQIPLTDDRLATYLPNRDVF